MRKDTMNAPAQFNAQRRAPWDVLGKEVIGKKTASEAIELAGLDWNVSLANLQAQYQDTQITVPGKFAVVREDNQSILGVVGNRYEPLQNAELFSFLDELVDSNAAHYECAGQAKSGKVVWMLLKPEDNTIEINGDVCESYILATTSHDGSFSVMVKPIVERIACANALGWALKDTTNMFKARHTRSLAGKVDEARTALKLTTEYQRSFAEYAKQLASIELTLQEEKNIIEKLVPSGKTEREENRRENVRSSILDHIYGPTIQENLRTTAWGFVQGVNDYELWEQGGNRNRSERQLIRATRGSDRLTSRARAIFA